MTAGLVAAGVVVACCGDHLPGGCCAAVDCVPCCPECPTCPVLAALDPAERAAEVARHHRLLAALGEWARYLDDNPPALGGAGD